MQRFKLPKKSKKPSGEISDHIECDEEVKFESLIVEKKPKGIGTKKMHAVVTSRNRMMFLNSTYYEKRHPDLELVPGMILTKKLTIEHPTTGEVTTLKFKKKPACAEFTKFLQRHLDRLERIIKRREKAAAMAAAETTTKDEQKTTDLVAVVEEEAKKSSSSSSEQKEPSESSSSDSE